MRQPLVAGNWKMHGTRASTVALTDAVIAGLSSVSDVQVVLMPPMVFMPLIAERLSACGVRLGAQTVCDQEEGAHTGEVSVNMLREFGCGFALAGHSERRQQYGESDELVAARAASAVRGGLTPIVCLGETLRQREEGQTDAVISGQFQAIASRLGANGLARSVIAYEPVWAIGTGLNAHPDQAQEVHALLRGLLLQEREDLADSVQILYGGSVKPENADALFSMPDIDGGLIGGASLDAAAFLAICRAAAKPGARSQERT